MTPRERVIALAIVAPIDVLRTGNFFQRSPNDNDVWILMAVCLLAIPPARGWERAFMES
jgi:hypothetical protein